MNLVVLVFSIYKFGFCPYYFPKVPVPRLIEASLG